MMSRTKRKRERARAVINQQQKQKTGRVADAEKGWEGKDEFLILNLLINNET